MVKNFKYVSAEIIKITNFISEQRLHTFRQSRVSQTTKLDTEDQDQQPQPQPQPLTQQQQQQQPQVVVTDQREQLQFQAAIPESVRPFKKWEQLK